jgi:hypothetical protein
MLLFLSQSLFVVVVFLLQRKGEINSQLMPAKPYNFFLYTGTETQTNKQNSNNNSQLQV